MLVDVWQWTPMAFLIVLAGLQSIPQELYEAARTDGASEWQCLRDITLPLAAPQIGLALLLRSIDTFKLFDKVYALTGGGPGNARTNSSARPKPSATSASDATIVKRSVLPKPAVNASSPSTAR
ncbi:sugar ABC transporter permease [Burkholderia pseudomallei]|nr:sugar ABC transporter permease [Burkholderia pseudomallei]